MSLLYCCWCWCPKTGYFQIPAPDKDANTVLDVQKIGYILHGRTIRPAAVGVSRK